MRSHPRLASLALLVLAAIHAFWGVRMLLASGVLLGGTQLVSAGGLVLAAVGVAHGSRGSLALGAGIAAAATFVRAFPMMAAPFGPPTLALAAGMGALAYGAWRLAEREDALGGAALRGGPLVMALAYGGFLALGVALGGAGPASIDLAARALAALALAATLDAPLVFERKAFARGAASADG